MTDQICPKSAETDSSFSRPFSQDWLAENVLDPALNAGVLSLYKTAADYIDLPALNLRTADTKPYTREWFVQGFCRGAGTAIPLALMGLFTGSLMKTVGRRLFSTPNAAHLCALLNSETAAAAAGAGVFGFLQKPEAGTTRLGNATGMAAGLLLFSAGNGLVRGMTVLQKTVSYPLVGLAGGGIMTEFSHFSTRHSWAPGEQVLQGAVQGLSLNALLGVGGDYISSAIGKNIPKSAPRASLCQSRDAELEPLLAEGADPNRPDYQALLLPDSKVVAEEVAKVFGPLPDASASGKLQIAQWNMEYLTGRKAWYFKDSYARIIPKHHLLFVEEANTTGMKVLAQASGYDYAISTENSRGQAVGFLLHPRLAIVGSRQIDAVASVFDIPDLRPALRVDLVDKSTGSEFSAVVVHFKSMLGGIAETAPIRKKQAQFLANELGPTFKGIVGGDFNTFLNRTEDLNHLKEAGFTIFHPRDNTSTQMLGGRLDGFLIRELKGTLVKANVYPLFANPAIGRSLSDHALLSTTLRLKRKS